MTKLFKRISAVAMAATMATTMAVSASAYDQDLVGPDSTAYGTAQGKTWVDTKYGNKNVSVETTCTQKAPYVCAGLAVLDPITGEDILDGIVDPSDLDVRNNYKTSAEIYLIIEGYTDAVSAFGSHEVFGSLDTWGDYTCVVAE